MLAVRAGDLLLGLLLGVLVFLLPGSSLPGSSLPIEPICCTAGCNFDPSVAVLNLERTFERPLALPSGAKTRSKDFKCKPGEGPPHHPPARIVNAFTF